MIFKILEYLKLEIPLINCEVNLILNWSVLTDMTTRAAVSAQRDNPARPKINAPTGAAFLINCYVRTSCYYFSSRQYKIIAAIKNRV